MPIVSKITSLKNVSFTVQSIKYLGSMIDRKGGVSKDVERRVAKAWSRWSDF